MIRHPLVCLALLACLLCASGVRAERYTVPLLVPATTADAPQGLLRVLNGTSDDSGAGATGGDYPPRDAHQVERRAGVCGVVVTADG